MAAFFLSVTIIIIIIIIIITQFIRQRKSVTVEYWVNEIADAGRHIMLVKCNGV